MINWKGTTPFENYATYRELPSTSKIIKIPEKSFQKSILFAIPFFIACFAALYLKEYFSGQFPFEKQYGWIGLLLGLLLIPVHELLHTAVYPSLAEKFIGIDTKNFMAYAYCNAPLKKNRFIFMSLLPMVLGIIPFIMFCLLPISCKAIAAILWPCALIGLVSPCPDYLNIYYVLKQAPKDAYIQDAENGMYWFYIP